MIPVLVANLFRLGLGILYPTYASFKALKTKTATNQYKWMMYWIVFALLSTIEGITDVLLGFWLPFYTEIKILLQIWLILPISPRSLGSGMLYQRFVHRYLVRREGEIDRAIMQFKEQGYASVTQGGKKVFHYVMNAICNFMINAPVYAAEFVQKYGFVNSEDTNKRATMEPKPNFFQDILDNIGSKFASYDKQYDSDRFEEIDGKEMQVLDDFKVPIISESEEKHDNSKEAQILAAKQLTKTKRQPKRKVSSKNTDITESSDEWQVENSGQAVTVMEN